MRINEFYEDCDIFLTGGSGVVGKALIYKLLSSCKVRRIYLLLRPKKSQTIEDRLAKIRNARNFRIIRERTPHELDKLVAIQGDAVQPKLGISAEDAKRMENVSVVVHCAATVRFDEPVKLSLKLNVAGTYEALRFAETLQHLKIFIHVSTFFSNPYLKYVDNKVYPSPMDWRQCLKLLNDDIDEDLLDILTKKMITGFPNTYTFTKNLAESVVNDFRHKFPVVIYRPSIVLFSMKDPEPGYPPSLMGATGLFALVGAGILKTVYIGKDICLDITPQDTGVKIMLFYGLKAAEIYKNEGVPESALVYQTSSTKISPISFMRLGEMMDETNIWRDAAYQKCFLIPGCVYTASRLRYMFLVFTKEVIPAFLADCLLKLSGRKPVLMSIVRKAFITLEVMQPFMFNNYGSSGFSEEEAMRAISDGTDFDVSEDVMVPSDEMSLHEIQRTMCYKIREVLLNEDPKTLPQARKILKIKIFVYNVIRAILLYFLIRWLYRVINGIS